MEEINGDEHGEKTRKVGTTKITRTLRKIRRPTVNSPGYFEGRKAMNEPASSVSVLATTLPMGCHRRGRRLGLVV